MSVRTLSALPPLSRLAAAIMLGSCALPAAVHADAANTDSGPMSTTPLTLVITSEVQDAPLTVISDPRQPRQPVPAHDGADYLKTVTGFSVIRKGGTDGDPVLRGMAGSRLGISLDGAQVLGGCGARMDPPTAYVFPEAYDRVVVLKGPQRVIDGPGNSAGSVRFERSPVVFREPGLRGRGSLTAGSFGRFDQVGDINMGNALGALRLFANHSRADNYRDGDGNTVHSAYDRWNAGGLLSLTPDADTRAELTLQHSDGEAAYADRSMDGVSFARDHVSLRLLRQNLSARLRQVEASAYYSDVDHVMDNYSLRPVLPGKRSVMNPTRETLGGRLLARVNATSHTDIEIGADYQENTHTNRMAMEMTMMGMTSFADYRRLPRVEDARFSQAGVFAEATHRHGQSSRLIAGARADDWRAHDSRQTLTSMAGGMGMPMTNPSAGMTRRALLGSGFIRHEQDLVNGATWYAGLGHSQRFPDYWELISYNKQSETSASAFSDTDPERTTQLDVGMVRDDGVRRLALSGFVNRIDDFILIQGKVMKPMSPMPVTLTRNIVAETAGAEAELGYRLSPSLRSETTLAYVRGRNRTDGSPLAQLPPLELRSSLSWQRGPWSAAALWRAVAAQKRADPDKGNIVGQDIGATPGFGVLSVNGGYAQARWQLTAGIDNLLDRRYAEHISRSGENGIAGVEQSERVNEPGRTLWARWQLSF